MDAAEEAYQAARAEIARVQTVNETMLNLSGEDLSALTHLPPEISKLTEVRHLMLDNTQVTDISFISFLKNLRSISLNNTLITDFLPLEALSSLHTLFLNNSQIEDLFSIANLQNLVSLSLNETTIIDFEPLASLISLRRLDLNSTSILDLQPLLSLRGISSLSLNHTIISDVNLLTNLSNLDILCLDATQVNDLAPLTELKKLRSLSFNRTSVEDLRPISWLENLGSVGITGISFRDTAATNVDARLALLANLGDIRDRTHQTLEYLRSLPPWPEPYTPAAAPDGSPPKPIGGIPKAPEQDPALPLIWGEKGFAFFAESIATDPVTEAALDDLRDLLNVLRRKGNAHDDLYRIVGEMQERSAGAVSDLNMVKLHLSYQKLRRLHTGRTGRDQKFDDETVSHMEAVFDILPGVTLADDNVRILIERQEAERAAGLSKQQQAASAKLLEDVQHPDAPFAPEVKDVAGAILKPGTDDRLSGTRQILSRNIFIVVVTGLNTASALITVGDFAYKFGPHLLTYAATMGDDAYFWAQSVFAKFRVEYELAMGIAHDVSVVPRSPRQRPRPDA